MLLSSQGVNHVTKKNRIYPQWISLLILKLKYKIEESLTLRLGIFIIISDIIPPNFMPGHTYKLVTDLFVSSIIAFYTKEA